MGNSVDSKLKYIEGLLEQTGQIQFDLEFFTTTSQIYVRTSPNNFQVEEISILARYIQDELAVLRKASIETLFLENKATVDPADAPAVQDKALQLESLNKLKDKLNAKSTEVYTLLSAIMDKFKEVQDRYEAERKARGPGVPVGNARLTLKPIDALKPLDQLKHTVNCFDFHTWYEEAEAWSQSSNFAIATSAVQKAFFCSIVNDVIFTALKPRITGMSTF